MYPEDGSDTIPINHKFIERFDRKISPFDVKDYVIITKNDGSLVSFDITIPDFSYVKKYRTFLLKPYFMLEENAKYIISISNKLLSEAKTSSFTTAVGDNTLLDISKGQDISHIERNSAEVSNNLVILCFKEHLNPYQVNIDYIKLKITSNSTYIDCTVDYDYNKRCVLIYPKVNLQNGIGYTALYSKEIEDLAGNTPAGNLYKGYDFTIE